MALTAEEILNAQDAQVIPLDVPEWGGSIFIRTMSGKERDRIEIMFDNMQDKKNGGIKIKAWRAEFASLVIADESGKRIFTDGQAVALGDKNGGVLDRIADAGMAHNKLDAASIEETEKNSESDQSEESGSD